MQHRFSPLLVLPFLVFALLLTACDSSSESESVAGRYALVRFSGESLPATALRTADGCGDGDALLVDATDGSLTLDEDDSFTSSITYRTHCENSEQTLSEQTVEGEGTYTVDGSTIRFSSDAGVYSGTLDGDAITTEETVPTTGGGSETVTARYER